MNREVSISEPTQSGTLTIGFGQVEMTVSEQELFDLMFLYKSMKRTKQFIGAVSKPSEVRVGIAPGDVFGSLTALGYSHSERRGKRNIDSYMRCLCECGMETLVRADRLKSGNTKSCGCKRGR